MKSTEFDEAIRQLRCLEKELGRQTRTAKSALAYIRERRSGTSDKHAREDLKFIDDELRENGRVDYARDNTREALAGRYVDQSGFRGHASMRVIEIRPAKKFAGAWLAFEAQAVEPAFPGPNGRQDAIAYASNRFGGSSGEVHVYDASGEKIVEKIAMDDRLKYPHAG